MFSVDYLFFSTMSDLIEHSTYLKITDSDLQLFVVLMMKDSKIEQQHNVHLTDEVLVHVQQYDGWI